MSNSGSNTAYYLNAPAAFFDFLVAKNKARVLTSAKLAVRNNKWAHLRSEDTILYYRARQPSSSNNGERPLADPLDTDCRKVDGEERSRHLSGFSYGVYLSVEPVIAEKEISLDIRTEVVSHVGFNATTESPILSAQSTDTCIRCRDGQEIVLGGMTRKVMVQRADKMPILGSLPVVGYLFGGDSTQIQRRQVVIVLTPRKIADYSAMTERGTKINATMIKAKALDEVELDVPRTGVGFDQWLLDME
jgi:type II secretory pathway component GspD/PulD (secretin)